VGFTICVSSTNERKAQVTWVAAIRQIAQRWAKINNAPPNGSPCHVPNSNEMTMKSPCHQAWKKYNGEWHA
jgi:hypothetical protein